MSQIGKGISFHIHTKELSVLVGAGNVRSLHELLASSSERLRDHFLRLHTHVRQDEDMVEEEAACDRPSFL